jgi:hypothetical protein
MKETPFTLFAAVALLLAATPELHADPIVESLQNADLDHDGALESKEVTAGLRRQLGLPLGTNTPALKREEARWRQVFGPGPKYPVQGLAVHPYYNEKIFGLGTAEPKVIDTEHLWVPVDEKPFKLRRSFEDFLETDFEAAKGAEISYTNDFNQGSEQWAFHGIVGYNWHQKKNVNFGADAKGVRSPLDPERDRGVVERWLRPSVQWDKVDTSKSDTDEIDSMIFRLTTGLKYATKDPQSSLFDGYRMDVSATYATDSRLERGMAAAELDFKPFKDEWEPLGFGLNGAFKRIGIFRIRPALTLHGEAGTVTDDGGDAEFVTRDDYLRLGGSVGLDVRFEQVTGRFKAFKGLLLHAGLQYYVDVTDSGPDVDLFTASADWALDDDGHYSLSVVYRNGRTPLVLERENRLTVGLGVKF